MTLLVKLLWVCIAIDCAWLGLLAAADIYHDVRAIVRERRAKKNAER